ncbi:hypothetical protein [Xanthomonas fragariae]|uniref:hypothetical protein n=1 Tax=Xanthomonas fragariae TaxID=48664 RepID=UPI003531576A
MLGSVRNDIDAAIRNRRARYIFISACVARLMRATPPFAWTRMDCSPVSDFIVGEHDALPGVLFQLPFSVVCLD